MAGKIGLVTVHATLLQGVAALNCANGVIGGAIAGVPFDTELYGFLINLTAVTATTLTVTGLHDSSGTLQPLVFNGQITTDTAFWFPEPILNEFAAFTFQPSAAGKVWVFTRQYSGPEAPTAGGFEIR
jgi:hypothetical protein